MKIRFNPKHAQIEFETPLEKATFENYYPIPVASQMEIKINFMPNINLRKKPDVKLSYLRLKKTNF